MASLLGIAVRDKKRAPMCELEKAWVTKAAGVDKDFRGKPGDRQVTVLTQEGWQATCAEVGKALPWLTRRANLYIEGVDLFETTGRLLKIGEMQLLITRETDPCERMTEACDGLFSAMEKEWRGGVCCRVIQDGEIHVGDRVEIIEP